VDDVTGPESDSERYRKLLDKNGELAVDLVRPDRSKLLVSESELEPGIDGYILDINLRDQVDERGQRFLGTGAGLAQDLRLLQTLGPSEGQKARPIVRLCAAQVFQEYLKGDDSTVDIFDLGFDKEMIGDIASLARAKLAVLPELYAAVQVPPEDPGTAAKQFLGVETEHYERLHSRFRAAFETELTRKPHEAVSFIIRELFDPAGLLIREELLAIRLGVDKARSGGWEPLKEHFAPARYLGVGCNGFHRWWMDLVLSRWAQTGSPPLFRISAVERVAALNTAGFGDLVALMPTPESPGDRPWLVSLSDDPALRLPVDPRHAFILSTPVSPWLDEPVWCLEQAKRNRRSPLLSQDARDRLRVVLRTSGSSPEPA
jgi:hypothetical protein